MHERGKKQAAFKKKESKKKFNLEVHKIRLPNFTLSIYISNTILVSVQTCTPPYNLKDLLWTQSVLFRVHSLFPWLRWCPSPLELQQRLTYEI